MNSFPQELRDKVFGYISPDDKETLRNCSLVAKSWKHTSQKRLFESVKTPPGNLQLWLERASRENVALLEHVRNLTCFQESCTVWSIDPALKTPLNNLQFLGQLRHFNLGFTDISSPPEIGSFKPALSCLTLTYCGISTDTLVAFINYFPDLEYLHLESLTCPVPKVPQTYLVPRPPLKQLYTDEGLESEKYLDLLDELSKLGLRFDQVFLKPTFRSYHSVNRVVRAFGAGTKYLRLPQIPCGMGDLFHSSMVSLFIILS